MEKVVSLKNIGDMVIRYYHGLQHKMCDELHAIKAHLVKLEALNDTNAVEIQRRQERELERLGKRVETLEALIKKTVDGVRVVELERQIERLDNRIEALK